MSTLTKVLIVLLTVFSIFLCGIVVTYVANAQNQRERADTLDRRVRSAEASQRDALADLEEQKKQGEQQKAELMAQISQLEAASTELQAQLNNLEREKAQLVQQVTNMARTIETANATQTQQTQLFENAQQEVARLQADQTRLGNRLAETDQTLLEKMSIIAQLEQKNRQLIEANQELEGRINRVVQQYGRAAAPPQPVTARRAIAEPAPPVTQEIGLDGRVTAVDIKNKLAQISIGTAAGVKQGMKFHVVRGQQFVCDILILNADPDKAAGTLELVQAEPQVGDMVTTNL